MAEILAPKPEFDAAALRMIRGAAEAERASNKYAWITPEAVLALLDALEQQADYAATAANDIDIQESLRIAAEAERDAVRAVLPGHAGQGDAEAKAMAWSAVWKAMEEAGLLSFIGRLGESGMERAVGFVRNLAAERDEYQRLRKEWQKWGDALVATIEPLEGGAVWSTTDVRLFIGNAVAERNTLLARLEAAEKLADALQSLRDEQNGPPLAHPRHKKGWEDAMEASRNALTQWEQAKGGPVP